MSAFSRRTVAALFVAALCGALAAPSANAVPGAGVEGDWSIVIDSPMGQVESVLSVVQDGEALTGTMTGQGRSQRISEGRIRDDQISWRARAGGLVHLVFSARVDGDSMSGAVRAGPLGDLPFSASRRPPP